MTSDVIHSDAAPAPLGPYSQAVRTGPLLALAGQAGLDPATGEPAAPDVAGQTRQALRNLGAVLEAAGAAWPDVAMVRVYLTSADHLAPMNEVYEALVPSPFPARTTVFVSLPAGLLVEIDALAVVH